MNTISGEVTKVSENSKINRVCDRAIVGITEGDPDALSVIYDSIGRQIYFAAYSLLKNHEDAEDVLQNVLIEIVNSAASYRRGSSARAWILAIAKNQALKYMRDSKSTIPLDDLENDDGHAAGDDGLLSSLTMFDALKTLSDEEQTLILLHIESGFKFHEIAELLNITKASAEKKYQRALKKLKAYYE